MTGGANLPVRANRRTRLGCLCCRRRRRKCDGTRPQCHNCRTRGEECRWGLKASFHPSRALELSNNDSAALLAIEEARGSAPPSQTIIVDNTATIVREYECEAHPSSPLSSTSLDAELAEEATPALSENITSVTQSGHAFEEAVDVAADPYITILSSVSQVAGGFQATPSPVTAPPAHILAVGGIPLQGPCTPRTRTHCGAQGTPPRPGSFVPPFSLGQAVFRNASPVLELELPVTKAEQCQLISAYLRETGPWCETTDSEMHFTVSSVHEMMSHKPFVAAAIALASKQIDAVKRQERQTTLALYQHAIQLLIHQDPSEADAAILATCTLLCVYEMMASDVSEWRRHLKGCFELLRSKNWNGSSVGIVNACFWAFARIDIWAAFMIAAATGTLDAYCNLATFFFAKIINFLADSRHGSESSEVTIATANDLWREIQAWQKHRPREALPLLRGEASLKIPFQNIIYTHSSPICGNTFYHAGAILLLRTGLLWTTRANKDDPNYDIVWHARELGGISISNTSHANWVNHLQPLYIAGQVFGKASIFDPGSVPQATTNESTEDEEYPAEKIALLKHLAKIERETGWKTSGRAAELRKLWGF